ncbi:MAG TPA: pilus assembly PilX N-terminal domain-containing protein [Solirubrobacteraceae bacterium]|jgi:Tfp pilus assembly protein PilX|nr:pilus assembly PilX N-terminal domain-containing protein [Solirubrobacteraceae bacterium]
MTKLRNEQGSALMMALMITIVALGIGTALLATSVAQQRAAGNQQSSETAYSLAEAALNAQVFELSQQWPTSGDAPRPSGSPGYGYPMSCNAASNGTSYCPAANDLSSYTPGSQTCPAGTQGDAWSSSSSVTNGWTTYVRDAGVTGSSSQSLFTSTGTTGEEGALAYDASASGSVWVRAVGIVNCHIAVLVTKVSDQIVSLNFPKFVLDANSFSVSDNGQKDIVNVQDTNGNTSQISLRCTGSTYGNGAQPPNPTCAGLQNPSQVQPAPSYASPPAASPTLNATQLLAVKKLAIQKGTYIPASVACSSITAAQLQGSTVYIEGNASCYGNGGISIPSNPQINAPPLAPGLLVLVNGTISFTGSATFYGVIYAPNTGAYTGDVVTLGGTSTVIGGVNVDGNAALNVGSSGNGAVNCTDTSDSQKCGDLEYNAAAFSGLSGFDGAASAPNMFRQLPNNQ